MGVLWFYDLRILLIFLEVWFLGLRLWREYFWFILVWCVLLLFIVDENIFLILLFYKVLWEGICILYLIFCLGRFFRNFVFFFIM